LDVFMTMQVIDEKLGPMVAGNDLFPPKLIK